MPYCQPNNTSAAGIAEISRRLAGLLHCLTKEINSAVVTGDINRDLRHFYRTMRTQLENEGWSFSYDGGPRLKVRPPGHPRPFPKQR